MKVLKRLLAILVLGILVILPHLGKAIAASNEQTSERVPVIFDTGGPDSLGYVWEDNDNGGGPVYEWIDITTHGIQVVGLLDDNTVGPVAMGFDFPYYGYTVNQMWIGSNGCISFSSDQTFAHPFSGIPNPSSPNDLVAILAGDLDFTQGNGECWYYTNSIDTFIISYLHVREFYWQNSSHTFQAIFTAADSSIKFQYGPNQGNFRDSGGQTLTLIGIENNTGHVGLEYLHNNLPIQHMWHEGLAILFHPGPQSGFLTGMVTDLQLNPINGAVVSAGFLSDTAGTDGMYFLSLYPAVYSVTAAAEFHNPVTIDGIVITTSDTTIQDFALPTPLINADTSAIQLQVEIGEMVTVQRNIYNSGDGVLQFYIEAVNAPPSFSTLQKADFGEKIQYAGDSGGYFDPVSFVHAGNNPPEITDFQDSVFALDLAFLNDSQLLGIEFDGTYFWITGGNNGSDPNKLYKLDAQGNFIAEYTQAGTISWGWRDMAFDGEFLYASDDGIIDQIDPLTGGITGVTINGPEDPNRALAYDPDTDHFFTANFNSAIYEFSRNGYVINSWSNNKDIYGMAFDDIMPGGPYLWIFSQDGTPQMQISQFDLSTGSYTGLSWQCALPTGFTDGIAGGACLTTDWEPSFSVLFLLGQGTPSDFIYGYQMAPGVNWLITNPRFGILQPGQDTTLDITIDFTDGNIVVESTYSADIYLTNNSSILPVIPVTATAIFILYESVIQGTVSDTSGIPIYGVTVLAEGTEITDTTDSLGQYSLEALAAGNYNITFSHPVYWDTTVADIYVGESDTTELNIEMFIQDACPYVVGDINASEDYNANDILYGVAYFKGNSPPMCESCVLCHDWYYCGDVNGSCSYNGLDITYGVAYFKGGSDPIPCPDCPQLE